MLSKMKKLLLLLLPLTFLSVPVQPAKAQYAVCTQYQESYQPGGYDRNGNYIQGQIVVQKYNVPCGMTVSSGGGYYQQPERTCNPEAGALLGMGIAGAIVGGDTYNYNENYYNNRSRGGYSGGQSGRYSSNNYWRQLGAGAGALLFGC
jgi:hypothetical protein